jgi:hypothetical protein
MSFRKGGPASLTETATDGGSSYSWHTDHYLVALTARNGFFRPATGRLDASAGLPEPRGSVQPETIPVSVASAVEAPPGDGFTAAVVAPASAAATVDPLVMASLCDALYDQSGQPSKPGWTPDQWNAALQQQPWTASWRFLDQSNVDPRIYFGVAFGNIDTGQIVIANRGTQTGYDLLVSDIDILKGIVPAAFGAAEQFAAEVVGAYQGTGREILVTGHSLGGADAEYEAAKLGLGGDTFAALGVQFAAAENAPNLVNYLFPQDAIANLGAHIGPATYLQPNGPAQWLDLLATLPYAGEGLHFINNYLEHFGATGIAPITPLQFVEAAVLADAAEFFSGGAASVSAAPQFGFDELTMPAVNSAAAIAHSMPVGNGGAVDAELAALLYGSAVPVAADLRPT